MNQAEAQSFQRMRYSNYRKVMTFDSLGIFLSFSKPAGKLVEETQLLWKLKERLIPYNPME
ncbi:hypothetical protein CHN50_12890 [Priestia aryabhattai]|nr:hypothetical protein CHN50_12890 [Priestia aryabhattai]